MGLSIVISALLVAEAGRHSFCLDTASLGRQHGGIPLLLLRWRSPEATFCRVDSEKFLLKTNKLQSQYVEMLFKSYSPRHCMIIMTSLFLSYTHTEAKLCSYEEQFLHP